MWQRAMLAPLKRVSEALLLACLLASLQGAAANSLWSSSKYAAAAEGAWAGQMDSGQCCHAAGSLHEFNRSKLPQNMAFLIGAQKSGTTFLFHELVARHPHIKSHRVEICTPQRTSLSIPMKEPHYFDRIPLGNFDKYLSRFRHESDPTSTYLDATPDYIHIPSTPCRIASIFPKARIVVMLKDPVMRALSGWNMVRHQGKHGVRTFTEEVQYELRILRELKCSFELNPPPTPGRTRPLRRSHVHPGGPVPNNSNSSGGDDSDVSLDASSGRRGPVTNRRAAVSAHLARRRAAEVPGQGQAHALHGSGPASGSGSASMTGAPSGGVAGEGGAASGREGVGLGQGQSATDSGAGAGDSNSKTQPAGGSGGAGSGAGSKPAAGSSSNSSSGRDNGPLGNAPSSAGRAPGTTAAAAAAAGSDGAAALGKGEGAERGGAAAAAVASDGAVAPGKGGGAERGGTAGSWQRVADIPSWNSCFRCDFSYCNGYTGPTDGHICRQDRMGTLGNLRRGLYVYQLEHWLQYFPPEQLLVVNYEQFLHDRETVLDTIVRFLGQDPQLKRSPEANKKRGFFTPHTSNATAIYSKVIDELYRYYAHANAELYRLMASLGHGQGGWNGTFPASLGEHLERQALARRQLASMAAAEAAAQAAKQAGQPTAGAGTAAGVESPRGAAGQGQGVQPGPVGPAGTEGWIEAEDPPRLRQEQGLGSAEGMTDEVLARALGLMTLEGEGEQGEEIRGEGDQGEREQGEGGQGEEDQAWGMERMRMALEIQGEGPDDDAWGRKGFETGQTQGQGLGQGKAGAPEETRRSLRGAEAEGKQNRRLRGQGAGETLGRSDGGPEGSGHQRGALQLPMEPDETPWYKTMMASWRQYGCKP